MLKRKVRNDNGGAIVEFVLVAPFLILLMIGAAELGRIAYFAIEVSNSARAAVAYGSQDNATAQDVTGMKSAATNDASGIVTLTFPQGPSTSCVCQTANSNTGATTMTASAACSTFATSCATSTTTGVTKTIVQYVQVTTQATINTMFQYPGIPKSFTLTGTAQMRVLQP